MFLGIAFVMESIHVGFENVANLKHKVEQKQLIFLSHEFVYATMRMLEGANIAESVFPA